MAVPYTFGTATSSIPLSQLDSNFNTVITLGNTAIQLGNTVTTLNNMTLANVTISSGNVTLTNVSITTANVTTANITTAVIGTETVTTSTITTANVTTANITTDNITNGTVITSLTLSYGTANGVAYLNGSKVLTTGSAFVFDGTNVSLGVSSTSYKFEVQGSANTYFGQRIYNTNAGSSAVTYLQLGNDTNGATAQLGLNSSTNTTNFGGANGLYLSNGLSAPIAFATAGSERMRIDSSGNVGIGTSSPSSKLTVFAGDSATAVNQVIFSGGRSLGANVVGSAGAMLFTNSYWTSGYGSALISGLDSGSSGGGLTFGTTTNGGGTTGTPSERMRIDSSGNLLVGTTLTNLYAQTSGKGLCYRNSASLDVLTTSDNCIILNRTTTTGQLQEFRYNGTAVGSISYNGSLTLYNQTSDQRLKENIVDAETALTTILQIKVRAFDWIESKRHEKHGVVAQELKDIAPQCVTEGTNHEDGSIDIPWQVDTSPLVPMLIKAIQEQQAVITSLTARITALESKG